MKFRVQCWRNAMWVNRVKDYFFWVRSVVLIRNALWMAILGYKFEKFKITYQGETNTSCDGI